MADSRAEGDHQSMSDLSLEEEMESIQKEQSIKVVPDEQSGSTQETADKDPGVSQVTGFHRTPTQCIHLIMFEFYGQLYDSLRQNMTKRAENRE